MRIISSAIALDLILGLTQKREGARLADLATAADTTLSAAQVAVRLLLADRLIEREPGRRPRYRLRRHSARISRARGAVDASFRREPDQDPDRALDVPGRIARCALRQLNNSWVAQPIPQRFPQS